MEQLSNNQVKLLEQLLVAVESDEFINDVAWAYINGIAAQMRLLSVWTAPDCKRVSDAIKDKPADYQIGYIAAMNDLIDLMKF